MTALNRHTENTDLHIIAAVIDANIKSRGLRQRPVARIGCLTFSNLVTRESSNTTHTPVLYRKGDTLMVRLACNAEDDTIDPPQTVVDVLHWHAQGLVLVATQTEMFVFTEDEYHQQV